MGRFVDREQDQLIAGKQEAPVEILGDIRGHKSTFEMMRNLVQPYVDRISPEGSMRCSC